ncbi:DUF2795 domain-containing protein [Paraburkholderia rhynchosiae]|uniref:DUF2795 domain-containing protein n=1 Tax=Paraburkholderia rhynchosiae TaxID=487049 RepID=A0A2N7WKC6_9BURK|nr:DUF2795 domain-containing protein [Paraburkholderia rhynchosiae]PMS29916.1 hypothetical protein C0Z16_15810 [Paraburkholderia rhynchosiae]CAB3696145.1 hypothetical protein LMG27174_03430 [Paraburkholderia rhynchosiae]
MAQHPARSQNHRHPDEPRPEEITRALEGAAFPTTRDKLVELATRNGADGEVLAVLKRMSDRNFDSVAAVVREASNVE